LAQSPRDLTPGRDARSFFGAELRHWRELRQFSQDRLGSEVHVSGDTIAKIEKALRWPHSDLAQSCDEALGTGGALGRLWALVDGERRRVARGQHRGTEAGTQAGAQYAARARVLAPPPPPGAVVRAQLLDEIVDRLPPGHSESAIRAGQLVAVCGLGGFGKTTIASLACADPRISDAFSDVLWVETGEHCSPTRLTALISDLCRHLGDPGAPFDDPEQAGFHLATVLSGLDVLLVVDNVWSSADLSPFLVGAANGVLLVTSRNARTCPPHARVVRLGPMATEETERLLAHALPEAQPLQLRAVARRCGGWPLLAAVVGSSLRQDLQAGTSPDKAVAAATSALDSAGPGAFDIWDADQRSTAIGEVLETSLASLEAGVRLAGGTGLRQRYLSLGIFPAATPIPIELLVTWWGRAEGWTPAAVRQFCRLLMDRSLAIGCASDEDAVMLHDVFRSYLRHLAADQLAGWHASLLDAHRPASASWADLEPGPRYLWRHLTHHLHEAARDGELVSTLASPDFVVAKAIRHGHESLAGDRAVLDACTPDNPEDKLKAETARILTGSGYLLNGLARPVDVAASLLVQCLRERASLGTDRLQELATSGEAGVLVRWAQGGPSDGTVQPLGRGHVGAITAVALHEERMVSVGEDGLVRLWDLRCGELTRTRRAHTGWIYATAISPDGQLVATAGDDGLVRVWRAQTGEPVVALAGHSRRIRALAFAPRGRLLLSGGEDGQVKVWDLESWSVIRSLQTPAVPVWSLTINAAQSLVAVGGEDRTVRLYDLGGGQLLDSAEADPDWVRVAAFARDRPLLATACGDGPVRFWDVRDRSLRPAGERHVEGRVRCAAFMMNDAAVVVGTEDASLLQLPLVPGEPITSTPPLEGVDWIRAVAVTSGGCVIAGCEDGALRQWDPTEPASPQVLAEGANTVWSTALLGERGLTLHGRGDGLIDVRDVTSGAPRERLTVGKGRVWSLAAGPAYVAATCGDATVRVWDAEGLAPVIDFDTKAGRTWAVALSPARSRLAASSADGTVRIWDLPSGELVARLHAHSGRIRSMAFDGAGDSIATAGGEGIARVWKVSTGTCLTEVVSEGGWVRCVDLDAPGERLAIGYGPGDIHVHDVGSRRSLADLRGHNGRVLMLAMSANPDVLVSAAADGTIRAWSISRRRQLAQVRADASLNCAAFDRNTDVVLAGSANGLTAIGVPDIVGPREDFLR
jgi:WD40 repeat protein/transcriptional regulator with XRE-family HTH domain